MKTVLLATSALVAFAGAAAAEITFDGDARLGLRYDDAMIVDTDEGLRFNDDDGFNVVSRARIRFTMTGETDSGLAFGARFRANETDRISGGPDSSNTDGEIWVEGAYGRLMAGDIDSALESAVGDLIMGTDDGIGVSGLYLYNEFQYTTSDYDTESDFNNAGLIYSYSFGNASIYASFMDQYYGTGGDKIDGDSYSIGLGYTLGNYTFGIGYESANLYIDPVIYTALNQDFEDAVFENDSTTWGISGGTSWAGISFKAIYLTTDVDASTDPDGLPFDYDIQQYGIGAEYVMANGVGLQGFYRKIDGDSIDGEDHEADMYGLGVSYDLGGGAELRAGVAHLDGSSPAFGGDFDRTSADFGVRMNF